MPNDLLNLLGFRCLAPEGLAPRHAPPPVPSQVSVEPHLRQAILPVLQNAAGADMTPEGEPVLDFIASTGRVDRYGEIIDPAGWELAEFMKNPVFLNGHRSRGIEDVLGRVSYAGLKTVIDPEQRPTHVALCITVVFAVNASRLAKQAYDLYAGGFLHAVSVGFIPKEWDDCETTEGTVRRYLRQELVEVSAVGVPANPDAVIITPSKAFARANN